MVSVGNLLDVRILARGRTLRQRWSCWSGKPISTISAGFLPRRVAATAECSFSAVKPA